MNALEPPVDLMVFGCDERLGRDSLYVLGLKPPVLSQFSTPQQNMVIRVIGKNQVLGTLQPASAPSE